MKKPRRGNKRIVEIEPEKEEFNERRKTGAFSKLETGLALAGQGITNVCGDEVGWGKKARIQPVRRLKK